MDLDLNCSPPSPEPAPQDHHLKRAMLSQENTFRHQVKDLHRLYWAHKNIKDVPFWMQSPHSVDSSSHMMDFHGSDSHPDAFGGSYELGKQALRYGDEAAGNLGARGSIRRKPDPVRGQGRSGYRLVIDLEKPPSLDDDDDVVEIISSAGFSDHANHNGGFLDNSLRRRLDNAAHVSSGSTGSNDTPDSYSSVKAKTNASGRMLIDLNISQQDDFNECSDPSKVSSSLLVCSTTEQSGEWCNNSSRAFHKGSEASIGSSKGSSITVLTSISAPDSSREVMAAGFCDPQGTNPFLMQSSKHDALLRGNILQQHTLDKVSGLRSNGCMEIPPEVLSVRSSGGNSSLMGEPAVVHMEQEEVSTVISDNEMAGFDLNVSVGSIDAPPTIVSGFREEHVNDDCSGFLLSSHYFAQSEGRPVEYAAIRDNSMVSDCMDGKSVRSPDSGIAANRSVLIPDTPQGRDYACPGLRSSNNRVSNPLDTISIHQSETEEDGKVAATAAETLVSLFTDNCAWIMDSHCSNNQTDDASHEPEFSLDSFEEGVMNLEETKDDGGSIPVRAPDMDGPSSCGIKLKRGRGMRDFQREILPGLVSLARHEICDDMHAIGYELRKTRSRRTPGDNSTPSTRSRLPRRCSTAWNQ